MKTRYVLFILLLISIGSPAVYTESVHIVKKNETLYSLAKQYGLSLERLIELNEIDDPSKIFVGMKLIIGEDREETAKTMSHRVAKGETLYGIAKQFDISLDELLKTNGLDKDYMLKAGDVLTIPGALAANQEDGSTGGVPGGDDEQETGLETEPEPLLTGGESIWPLPGEQVPADGKIAGVYISGREGDNIRSISSGSVVWVGPYRGFGKVILVQSDDSYVYVYGGNADTHVAVGQDVSPGMVISTLGINPHTQAPQLFFSVYRNGKPVDPSTAPRS